MPDPTPPPAAQLAGHLHALAQNAPMLEQAADTLDEYAQRGTEDQVARLNQQLAEFITGRDDELTKLRAQRTAIVAYVNDLHLRRGLIDRAEWRAVLGKLGAD